MNTSRRKMSLGLTFSAGTLVGAIAVFVPLTSAGHSESNAEGSGRRSPGAVRSSAPAAGPNFLWWIGDDPRLPAKAAVDADSSTSMKQDSSKPDEPSNEGSCDVQLD